MVDSDLVLDVRDLRMRYGTKDVLSGVSFQARRGEVLALLGPNGAGKTTTIEILEGFRLRSAGHVRVLGADPAHGDEAWRARLGIVLQSWRDHGKWRVRELLDYLSAFYLPYAADHAREPWDVNELLDAVGLTRARAQAVRATLRRPAPPAGRRHRDRRAAATAVPGRADGRVRPGRPPGVPRPVLGGWALVGFAMAPVVLRRTARRESGSAVAARRERAMSPSGEDTV
jgi:ABC-type glutathione transport system ATPase component